MEFNVSVVALSSFGIVLNMAGVILIAAFGLPSRVDAETRAYIAGVEPDDEKIKRSQVNDVLSFSGVFLLLAGFFLQLLANYVQAPLHFNLSLV